MTRHGCRNPVTAFLVAAWLVSLQAAARVELSPDPRAVSQAIAIGQSRNDRERALFHEPYRIVVKRPPVDYVEVITPFRRIVLAAQARAQAGDRTFLQRQGLAMLTEPPEVELAAEFTFHPLNTYVGVPAYAIVLVDRSGARVPALGIERRPRHGPRVEGVPLPLPIPGGLRLPETSEPLLGGSVIARFNARLLNPLASYDVLVEEGKKEIARARVDFGRLR